MNDSHFVICNRQGLATRDGWIHIVPKGELPNHAANVVQVLDDESLSSIMANIAAAREKLGDRWPGIYGGREHFIYNSEQDSAALAWFTEFERRPDGIWAKEDGLTADGVAALKNRAYKFTSFTADRRQTQPLPTAKGQPQRLRILMIDTVGFTNQPNGRELLSPINNRAGSGETADQTQHTHRNMKSVATLLGLQEDASEASIHQAVATLKNRAESAERELAPLKNRNAELETKVQKQAADQVETDIAPLLNRTGAQAVKPEVLASFRKQLLANRDEALPGFLAFVTALGTPAGAAAARLTNRAAAGHPGSLPGATEAATQDDALVKNRETEIETYRLANRCTYEQARDQVRRLKPNLFGL